MGLVQPGLLSSKLPQPQHTPGLRWHSRATAILCPLTVEFPRAALLLVALVLAASALTLLVVKLTSTRNSPPTLRPGIPVASSCLRMIRWRNLRTASPRTVVIEHKLIGSIV